jgi:hypothetical protein
VSHQTTRIGYQGTQTDSEIIWIGYDNIPQAHLVTKFDAVVLSDYEAISILPKKTSKNSGNFGGITMTTTFAASFWESKLNSRRVVMHNIIGKEVKLEVKNKWENMEVASGATSPKSMWTRVVRGTDKKPATDKLSLAIKGERPNLIEDITSKQTW